jgi:hypothetical protein
MIRSIYFTFGLFIALWGLSLICIDSITIKEESVWLVSKPSISQYFTINDKKQRILFLPSWIAFGLVSFGTVTMLYSVALPDQDAVKKKI